MITIRKILFPTDFSEASEAAWPYAATLAEQLGAEVIFLHVVPEKRGEVHLVAGFPCGRRTSTAACEGDRLKADAMTKAGGSEISLTPGVREGLASWEIVAEAREAAADLIVMGTHGRTGLTHLVRGSVADTVVREAPCPVITVRPPGPQGRPRGRSSVRDESREPAIGPLSRGGDGSHAAGAGSSRQVSGRAHWTSASR